MHSRIFQISRNPINPSDHIGEDYFYDTWFTSSVADYVDADTDRADDINWLSNCVAGVSFAADDEGREYLIVNSKQEYFAKKYEAFKKAIEFLSDESKTTLDTFAGNSLSMPLYNLNSSYNDKYGFYICDCGELAYEIETFDTFVRGCELNTKYYIGSTIDYHF